MHVSCGRAEAVVLICLPGNAAADAMATEVSRLFRMGRLLVSSCDRNGYLTWQWRLANADWQPHQQVTSSRGGSVSCFAGSGALGAAACWAQRTSQVDMNLRYTSSKG
jgi:hypothetical protein